MSKTNGNTSTSNGNGSSGDVRSQLGAMNIDDLVDASVLSLFFVQKLGKAARQDVHEKMEAIGAIVNINLLDQSLEALRGRGLLSYARGAKRDGESVKMYKTTKVKWAAPPEVAHVKDLLAALVSTEEGTRIINILNEQEEVGDGEKKAKRKLGYAEYFEISCRFKLKTPILGSQPESPYLKMIVKESSVKAPGECDLRFWRDEETGKVMIPSDVVCGWLRTGIRYGFNKADTAASYIAADDVLIDTKEVYQAALPVISQGKGAGINTYEVVRSRTLIDVHLRVPARGVCSPKAFVMWLACYAPRPMRGLSPARGRRFGKMELVDYTIHGASHEADINMGAFIDSLSKDGKELVTQLLAEATQNKVDFTKQDKGAPKKGGLN